MCVPTHARGKAHLTTRAFILNYLRHLRACYLQRRHPHGRLTHSIATAQQLHTCLRHLHSLSTTIYESFADIRLIPRQVAASAFIAALHCRQQQIARVSHLQCRTNRRSARAPVGSSQKLRWNTRAA